LVTAGVDPFNIGNGYRLEIMPYEVAKEDSRFKWERPGGLDNTGQVEYGWMYEVIDDQLVSRVALSGGIRKWRRLTGSQFGVNVQLHTMVWFPFWGGFLRNERT